MASLSSAVAQIELLGSRSATKGTVKAAPVAASNGLRMGKMPGQQEAATLASRVPSAPTPLLAGLRPFARLSRA